MLKYLKGWLMLQWHCLVWLVKGDFVEEFHAPMSINLSVKVLWFEIPVRRLWLGCRCGQVYWQRDNMTDGEQETVRVLLSAMAQRHDACAFGMAD